MRKQDLMNNAEFINKAKYIVAKYTNENILKPEQGLIIENEVFFGEKNADLLHIFCTFISVKKNHTSHSRTNAMTI